MKISSKHTPGIGVTKQQLLNAFLDALKAHHLPVKYPQMNEAQQTVLLGVISHAYDLLQRPALQALAQCPGHCPGKRCLLVAWIKGMEHETHWGFTWENLSWLGKYRRIKQFLKWWNHLRQEREYYSVYHRHTLLITD